MDFEAEFTNSIRLTIFFISCHKLIIMKNTIFSISFLAVVLLLSFTASAEIKTDLNPNFQMSVKQDSVLRHVVLFKFKEGTTQENIKEVVNAFSGLQSKIPQINSYEWGINNSPEGLEKGFTHCFFLTFKSEEDRAIYLPHPDHKGFGSVLSPYLADVLVVDYWTK